TTDERAMINRVLDLQNLTLRQIAIPLSNAVTVSAKASVDEVLSLARVHHFNRLPVWSEAGAQRKIVGVLNLRSLLYEDRIPAERPAGDYLQPALYLEEETRLEIALRQMQRTGQRLAIVLGRNQRELGVVGLQDVLKVIFGEVRLWPGTGMDAWRTMPPELGTWLWKALAVVILVLLNGFFVAAEFAMVKVRHTQIAPLIAKGRRRARFVNKLIGQLDATIGATQLGITLVNLGLGVLVEPV